MWCEAMELPIPQPVSHTGRLKEGRPRYSGNPERRHEDIHSYDTHPVALFG